MFGASIPYVMNIEFQLLMGPYDYIFEHCQTRLPTDTEPLVCHL